MFLHVLPDLVHVYKVSVLLCNLDVSAPAHTSATECPINL